MFQEPICFAPKPLFTIYIENIAVHFKSMSSWSFVNYFFILVFHSHNLMEFTNELPEYVLQEFEPASCFPPTPQDTHAADTSNNQQSTQIDSSLSHLETQTTWSSTQYFSPTLLPVSIQSLVAWNNDSVPTHPTLHTPSTLSLSPQRWMENYTTIDILILASATSMKRSLDIAKG